MKTTNSGSSISIKYAAIWLVVVAVLMYLPSVWFGFTELDDTILIRDQHVYNGQLSSLLGAFHRGVFFPVSTYYRPLFLDSIILNYQWCAQSPMGYHVINIVLHVVAVLLLFSLFKKLNVKQLHAFLLCLIFAVHPALSQCVAWIPGRNDTLLAIFTLSFFICSINYTETGRIKWLVLSVGLLACAFFTKETAVFAAPVAFVLLVLYLGTRWNDKRNVVQYVLWIAVFGVWYGMRLMVTLKPSHTTAHVMLYNIVHKIPSGLQYVGKIILPFNLSVLPLQQDTVYYFGFISVVVLALAIVLTKEKNWRLIVASLLVFVLFLIPAFLIPGRLNQSFEQRLYLPTIGILLLASQTVVFKSRLKDKQLIACCVGVACLFAGLNYRHQKNFKDPNVFWTNAYRTSPHSVYAMMMYAVRIPNNKPLTYSLLRKAYALDPHQRFLNFHYGVMLQEQDSVLESEKYFFAEKQLTPCSECDVYLRKVAEAGTSHRPSPKERVP